MLARAMTPTVRCLARSGAQISERRESSASSARGSAAQSFTISAIPRSTIGGGKSRGGNERGSLAIARGPKRGDGTERAAGLFHHQDAAVRGGDEPPGLIEGGLARRRKGPAARPVVRRDAQSGALPGRGGGLPRPGRGVRTLWPQGGSADRRAAAAAAGGPVTQPRVASSR